MQSKPLPVSFVVQGSSGFAVTLLGELHIYDEQCEGSHPLDLCSTCYLNILDSIKVQFVKGSPDNATPPTESVSPTR